MFVLLMILIVYFLDKIGFFILVVVILYWVLLVIECV